MSKLAQGPATLHVLGSNGPSSNPLAFYSTTYSVYHGGQGKPGAEAAFRHKGTGYEANFKPAIFYSSKLDQLDNPAMGHLIKDNYRSHTHREYTGYPLSKGTEPFPGKVAPFTSGYGSSAPRTVPRAREIPLSATEYNTHFQLEHKQGVHVRRSRHSNKEDTGFTHAYNVEPVTFRPNENHTGDLPGHVTWRPTGDSIMKKSFLQPNYLKGKEALESVCAQEQHGNGFIKGSKAMADVQPTPRDMVGYTVASQVHPTVVEKLRKRDPAEHSIFTHPQHYTSYTQRSFGKKPLQRVSKEREAVGGKELTGFAENNCPLLVPADKDSQRYSTHYQSKFADPSGSVRECAAGGLGSVHPPACTGFCKGTVVNGFRQLPRPIRDLDPYVARSAVKRDPCCDDHTHDGKKH